MEKSWWLEEKFGLLVENSVHGYLTAMHLKYIHTHTHICSNEPENSTAERGCGLQDEAVAGPGGSAAGECIQRVTAASAPGLIMFHFGGNCTQDHSKWCCRLFLSSVILYFSIQASRLLNCQVQLTHLLSPWCIWVIWRLSLHMPAMISSLESVNVTSNWG